MNQNNTFTVHHLRFEVEATTPLVLPSPTGPKLRAALYGALGMVCPLQGDANAPPEHKAACPVCWLLATERPGNERGKDLPRPMTIEPPLNLMEAGRLGPGERFSFGLSLFAQAANLFPYLALGVPEMGRRGLGRRLPELGGGRGRFELRRAEAVNPLSGERQCLLDIAQGPLFQVPSRPVTQAQVEGVSQSLLGTIDGGRIEVRFLTPTRIVADGRLVHVPHFAPLFARLYDRLGALSTHYASGALAPREAKGDLMALADQVQLVEGRGGWADIHSHSRRLGKKTPLGGFVGRATFRAPLDVWQALLPYLLWGQSVHVGKSATRGDGWYEIGRAVWPLSDI